MLTVKSEISMQIVILLQASTVDSSRLAYFTKHIILNSFDLCLALVTVKVALVELDFIWDFNCLIFTFFIWINYFIELLLADWAQIFGDCAPRINTIKTKIMMTAFNSTFFKIFQLFHANCAIIFLLYCLKIIFLKRVPKKKCFLKLIIWWIYLAAFVKVKYALKMLILFLLAYFIFE